MISGSEKPIATMGHPAPLGRSAIVIGSGFSGLLTARVLSDFFRDVVVLESDPLPDTLAPREGLAQGFHMHALLKRGEDILSGLFPGFTDAMLERGAIQIDPSKDVQWYGFGRWAVPVKVPYRLLSMTRPLLEGYVRDMVRARSNIVLQNETTAEGLIVNTDTGRVCGVTGRRTGMPAHIMDADFVVDTSGRSARLNKWLRELGYPVPGERRLGVNYNYAGALFRKPEDFSGDWKSLYILTDPPHGDRGGAIMEVEGGQWLVTLAGRGGVRPPSDESGFLGFAKTLPNDLIATSLKHAERVSPIRAYGFSTSAQHLFHKLGRHPAAFLAAGDALTSFNPVYGQGMTMSALQADVLLSTLLEVGASKNGIDTAWRTYYPRVANAMEGPLGTAQRFDLLYKGTVARRPWYFPIVKWPLQQSFKLSFSDPLFRRQLMDNHNLVRSAAPLTLGDILAARRRARRRRWM